MKTVIKKTLIVMILVAIIITQSGCMTRESFEVVLHYTRLYAIAHGYVTRGGKVDGIRLIEGVIIGDKKEQDPYERGVRFIWDDLNRFDLM